MAGKHPKKWKIAVLTWIAIYPTITVLLGIAGGFLSQTDVLAVRTLLLTLVMVPFMVFLLVPFLQKLFSKWLLS